MRIEHFSKRQKLLGVAQILKKLGDDINPVMIAAIAEAIESIAKDEPVLEEFASDRYTGEAR